MKNLGVVLAAALAAMGMGAGEIEAEHSVGTLEFPLTGHCGVTYKNGTRREENWGWLTVRFERLHQAIMENAASCFGRIAEEHSGTSPVRYGAQWFGPTVTFVTGVRLSQIGIGGSDDTVEEALSRLDSNTRRELERFVTIAKQEKGVRQAVMEAQ